METINGYELVAPLTADNSGFGRWGFARKDGLEVFIKEFLSPVYPIHAECFAEEEMDRRIGACDDFVRKKQRLYGELSKCRGGNIIVVLDFFRFGSKYYIVTEKVDSAAISPEDVFRDFDFQKKILLAKVICDSINELHCRGIIHADLKPGNILLKKTATGFFTAKIIDFDSSFLEGQSLFCEDLEGDPVYLAPEVFLAMRGQKAELSVSCDVFSLGVLFYQVFFGSLPVFAGNASGYAFESVLNGREVLVPSGADPHLGKLISSMLHPNPKKRPQLKKVLAQLDKIQKKH